MKKVIVVIPTYNEVATIKAVVVAIEKKASSLSAYKFDVLVVDDNSPDRTAKQVKDLQHEYGNIELLSAQKAGLGNAYLRGFRHVLRHTDAEIIIMMDADLSHNPKDIPVLLEALQHGADYVIGSRYVMGGVIDNSWPLGRIMMSRLANFAAHKLVGITGSVTDLTSGFKAINSSALKQINLDGIIANGHVFQLSLLHAFLREGFRVAEVPITFTNRQQGHSKLKLQDIFEFIYRAFKLNPNAPIQRFARFGFVGACGTLVNVAILSFLVNVWHVDTLLSVAIAIEISILFNFSLNHRYTFKGYGSFTIRTKKDSPKELFIKIVKFNIGALSGAIISFTVFALLFKLVHLHYLLADIIAIATAMSWNYFVSTRFIWKAIDKS